MSNDPFFRPTLLVGVGGSGCRIAEGIFSEARHTNKEMRDRIGVLVFDTDAHDLAKMPSIPNSSQIQFSTADPVYKIVRNNPDIEGRWFPPLDELPHEIKNMVLVEGAGQVRMLTRLALHDAFRQGEALRRVTSAIAAIAVNDGRTKWDGAINVLVVGSMAGATGSGSFYQIAMMLRNACERSQVQPNIMGLFLMPDVYVRTGALPSEQIPNVQANAYAAIKELNALNVLATLPERGAQFSYEYMPGREMREGETPFSSVTFIDFESSRGGNMGRSISNYQDMAKRAGYMLIFSPLGAKYGSMTVNDIRAKMMATFEGDSNIYSSIGISALNYPSESTRDYLADRLVLDNIDENWVRLDELFRDRARAYAERKKTGKATGEEPDIEETYLRDLELLAEEEKVPFFRDVWDDLHPEIVDEETGRREKKALYSIYLDALLDNAKGGFWRADRLADIAARQAIESSIFEVKSRIADNVRDSEISLDEDFRVLANALRTEPETIFNSSWTTADTAKESDWRDSNIQSFVIRNGPHPVRTRAFLYQLKKEISARRQALDPEGIRQKLFGLATVFNPDRDRNPTSRGDPAIFEKADAASGRNQGLISRFTGTSSREFVGQYSNYYNSSRMFMRRYGEESLQAALLEALEKEVNQLILAYTGLFSEIESISREITQRIERAEVQYEGRGSATDGNVWIYSDRKSRLEAWKRVRDGAAMVSMDDQINRELSESLFKLYREAQKHDRGLSFNELGDLFRESVV